MRKRRCFPNTRCQRNSGKGLHRAPSRQVQPMGKRSFSDALSQFIKVWFRSCSDHYYTQNEKNFDRNLAVLSFR